MKKVKNASAGKRRNIITNNEEVRWVNFQWFYTIVDTTKLTLPIRLSIVTLYLLFLKLGFKHSDKMLGCRDFSSIILSGSKSTILFSDSRSAIFLSSSTSQFSCLAQRQQFFSAAGHVASPGVSWPLLGSGASCWTLVASRSN